MSATCLQFLEIYRATSSILTHGELSIPMPHSGKNTPSSLTHEIKAGMIRFDNGSRILAFSSNPNALRAFGGDVGIDEFAFHPAPSALWAAASGRTTWGFSLGVWSSCNGTDTLFQSFVDEAHAQSGGMVLSSGESA